MGPIPANVQPHPWPADYFLKITTKGLIEGEVTAAGQEKAIEVRSFALGCRQNYDPAKGQATGKMKFDTLHIAKQVDKATPLLMLACASGEAVKKAVLTCRRAGGPQLDYYIITLQNAVIASWHNRGGDSTAWAEQASQEHAAVTGTGGHDADHAMPYEVFSIGFTKIEIEYRPQNTQGGLGNKVTASYDVKSA